MVFFHTFLLSTIAAYAPIGAGGPKPETDNSTGIKAYSMCSAGEGPFTCEMSGPEAMSPAGGEYGMQNWTP